MMGPATWSLALALVPAPVQEQSSTQGPGSPQQPDAAVAEDAQGQDVDSEAAPEAVEPDGDAAPQGADEAPTVQPTAEAQKGAGAVGGQGYTPLPPPPRPQPKASVHSGPWRGRFWFDFRVEITTPLGGKRPARATVTSGAGALLFGWRIRNWVGLFTSIGTQVHDTATRLGTDIYGDPIRVRDLGRLTIFDFVNGRFFLPLTGRVQPFLDIGGGGAVLASAFDDNLDWGWQGRTAIGFDGWVSRSFTLGVNASYRLLGVENSVGHSFQAGFVAGAHW